MNQTDFLPNLYEKAQTFENQIELYTNAGIPPGTASHHKVLAHKASQQNIITTLADLTRDVSRLLPAHWTPLNIYPIFSRSGYVMFTQVKPKNAVAYFELKNPHAHDPASHLGDWVHFDAKSFIRYVGMLFETVQMVDVPLNKHCAERMDRLEQPHLFETRKPFSIYVDTVGQFGLQEGYNLHDAYGQAIVQGQRWTLRQMMTGSQRKDINQSFQDGQKALRRNYFKYLDKSWMLDVKIATEIFDLDFLTKTEKSIVIDLFRFENADIFLKNLLKFLRSSPKEDTATYVCFPTKGPLFKKAKSQMVEAYSPAHAMVKDQLLRAEANSVERKRMLDGSWTEWSVSKVIESETFIF